MIGAAAVSEPDPRQPTLEISTNHRGKISPLLVFNLERDAEH